MNAYETIDAYVRDVAACLPRSKRDDVAIELRALLHEELAAHAQVAGREPDPAMVLDLLKHFGRPADAAQRYHERPVLIEAADTHHVLIWATAGIAVLAIRALAGAPVDNPTGVFLGWLGILLVIFVFAGWLRRRRSDLLHWTPTRGPDFMPRSLALLAMTATLIFPLAMYAGPQTFTQTVFLGLVPSDGLALTEAFRHSWQRALTLACLFALAVVYACVAIQARWQAWTRWPGIAVNALLGFLLILHAGPMSAWPDAGEFVVFQSAHANRVAAPTFGLIGGIILLLTLYDLYRERQRLRPLAAIDARTR